MLLSFVFRASEKIDVFGEWSLKFMCDATYALRDKSEVEGQQNLSERGTLVPQIRAGLIHKRD